MWCHSQSTLPASTFTLQGLLQLEEIIAPCSQSCRGHARGLPDSCRNLGTTVRPLGVSSGAALSQGGSRRCTNQPVAVRPVLSLHACSLHMAKEGITHRVQKLYWAPRPNGITFYSILSLAFPGSFPWCSKNTTLKRFLSQLYAKQDLQSYHRACASMDQ